jgi:16S rRNA (cytidine1402-2'-O)-methyltransferase
MSNLYIVGTPIGNLEDITLRAVRIMGEVDFILAEDTRVTRKLLNSYKIGTKVISFHEHSKENSYENILKLLQDGKNLALVTDAGTPGISNPGSKLVERVRRELLETKIVSVPGPSSVTAAISISGIPMTNFYFAGFAPHKKGRQTFFKNIFNNLDEETAFVFFESPHRIIKALNSLNEYWPDKKIVITREITKIFEETLSGTAIELLGIFNKFPEKIRGEFVVIIF